MKHLRECHTWLLPPMKRKANSAHKAKDRSAGRSDVAREASCGLIIFPRTPSHTLPGRLHEKLQVKYPASESREVRGDI